MTPVIENNLQVGVQGDRVVMGINKQAVASFSSYEAMILASLLLKHAATIMAGPGRQLVKEAIEFTENGAPKESPA